MMEHPAHRIAGMAADVAGELRGYLAPAVDLPWELTEDDHRDLVPRLCDAVARLAECIGSIAQATTDEDAKRQLTEGARTIPRGCAHVQAAGTVLLGEQRGAGPGAAARPPQLAASDFPQPMTGHLLQAAGAGPAPATTTATARPARQAAPEMPGRAAGEAAGPASSPRR
jgi:hypothetical protein